MSKRKMPRNRKGNDGLAMEDEPEGEREVADCPAKNISMAQKVGYTGVDKAIRKYEDAPAERVSLKGKLEAMKERVAKGEYQKPEIKIEKDAVR